MRSLGWPLLRALGVVAAAALTLLLAIDISIRAELLGHLYRDATSAPTTPVALIRTASTSASSCCVSDVSERYS